MYVSMKTWVFVFIIARFFIDGAEEYFMAPTAWYYIKSLGQTKVFLGIVLSAYCVGAVLAGPIVGRLADKFRRIKCIIIFCFVLKLGGNLIYSIPVSAYFPLAGRFTSGVAEGSSGVLFAEVALHTEEKYRAKAFILIDGIFSVGAAFGPAVSSLVTFNVNIFGWKISAGNSPAIILAIIWLFQTVVALFLPNDLGNDRTPDASDDEDKNPPTKQASRNPHCPHFESRTLCLYYIIFCSKFFSAMVNFYTPLLALELLYLPFIYVKLIFLVGSMFSLALFLSLYIALEYFDERRLMVLLMMKHISAITILAFFAFSWHNHSANDCYILIVFISVGMSNFTFLLSCSLLSKITDPKNSAFYQGLAFATLNGAFITSRLVSSSIFTKTSLISFCSALTLFWGVGVIWYFLEYRNLVSREIKRLEEK